MKLLNLSFFPWLQLMLLEALHNTDKKTHEVSQTLISIGKFVKYNIV